MSKKIKRKTNAVFIVGCALLAISLTGTIGVIFSEGSDSPSNSDSSTVVTKYSIKVDDSVHAGTVVHVQNEAEAGEQISFTVDVYGTKEYISAVKVNNQVLTAIDGSYSFTMPDENVVILIEYGNFYGITVNNPGHNDTSVTIKDKDGNEIAQAKEGDEIYFTVSNTSISEYITTVKMNGVALAEEAGSYKFAMPAEQAIITIEYKNFYTISVDNSGHNDTTISIKNASGDDITFAKESEEVFVTVNSTSEAEYIVGVKMNDTELTANEGVYKFAMPAENVVIAIKYKNYYSISVNNTGHNDTTIVVKDASGKLVSKAKEGDEINFTVSCSSATEYITAVKVNGNAVTENEGVYSFTMPAENVSITVDYKSYYTLSVSKHDTTTVTVKDSVGNDIASSKEGETISLSVSNTSEDEYISSIKVNEDEIATTDGTYTFTMPAENVTIVIEYKSFYTISYNDEGRTDTTVTIEDASGNTPTKLKEGDIVSITVSTTVANPQYLSSIKANGVEIATDAGTYDYTMPAADVVITVEYKNYHTITANVAGHSGTAVKIFDFATNKEITYAKEGQVVRILVMCASTAEYVSGVRLNGKLVTDSNFYTFNMPDEDVIITCDYKPKYNLTSDSSVHTGTQVYFTDKWDNRIEHAKDGDTVKVVVRCTSTSEYVTSVKFNGTGIGTSTGTYSITVGFEDVVISLEYKNYYTITANTTGHPDTSVSIQDTGGNDITYAKEGDSVSIIVANTSESEYITSVKMNGSEVGTGEGTYTFAMPAENVQITFEYKNYYTITANTTNVSIKDASGNEISKAKEDETISFAITPSTKESVKSVSVNGNILIANEGFYTFMMPKENVSIEVTYTSEISFESSDAHGYFALAKDGDWDGDATPITTATYRDIVFVYLGSPANVDKVYANGVECEKINASSSTSVAFYVYKFTMPNTAVTITYTTSTSNS